MNNHHKLTIKHRATTAADQPSTWHNIELYLDGKDWKGVTSLNIDMQPGELAKVTVTMFANLDIDDLSVEVIKSDDGS